MKPVKTCTSCKITKSVKDFYPRRNRNNNTYQSLCKICNNEKVKRWVLENPEKRKKNFKAYYDKNRSTLIANNRIHKLKRAYGLNQEQWARMVLDQQGMCAICKNEFKSMKDCQVDHNHITGNVRALLCIKCNFGIGYFCEDTVFLYSAIDYLKSHQE